MDGEIREECPGWLAGWLTFGGDEHCGHAGVTFINIFLYLLINVPFFCVCVLWIVVSHVARM